jgi:S-adenosylmethionine-dependent methyltransferase
MLSASLQNRIRKWITPVPKRLSSRFRKLTPENGARLRQSLETGYFSREIWGGAASATEYFESKEGKDDLEQHLFGRLDNFRATVIPWLEKVVGLEGKRVLEIGCGTGTSTVALAEQGARITAMEIDEPSLGVARDRCELYGLDADFVQANGADVLKVLGDRKFDLIIYMAVVEHMTIPERLKSLAHCWSLLDARGSIAIIETPNRLWIHDAHTSWLPFYFWLPDELAYMYSRKSPRNPFSGTFRRQDLGDIDEFRRHGRGVSFHEIELALGDDGWKPLLGMRDFLRRRSLLWNLVHLATTPHAFQRSLRRSCPEVSRVFFEQSLDVVIQKI